MIGLVTASVFLLGYGAYELKWRTRANRTKANRSIFLTILALLLISAALIYGYEMYSGSVSGVRLFGVRLALIQLVFACSWPIVAGVAVFLGKRERR